MVAVDTVGIDYQQFSGFYVPYEFCADQREGAGFAGYNVAVFKAAQRQGAEAVLVAAGVQGVLCEHHGGVCAVKLVGGMAYVGRPALAYGANAYQVAEQLTVRC